MKRKNKILKNKSQCGGMLIELMLAIGLASVFIPFVFRYQQNAVLRAKNIHLLKELDIIKQALERYIIENKSDLMLPIDKSIFRLKITDLKEYGLSEDFINNYEQDCQLRILKTADKNGKSTLQGVIIFNNDKISPLRTRSLVGLGGNKIGFVDNTGVHNGFGSFHADKSLLDFEKGTGIIGTTSVARGKEEFLWRVPSNNEKDSTMLSSLNLDGHDVLDVNFFDSERAQIEEFFYINKLSVKDLSFSNRFTIDSVFKTNFATVLGTLSSDSRSLNISGTLSLADSAKFSSFYTDKLYVNTLTLNGFSASYNSNEISKLKIIGNLDLNLGYIEASYINVGYTGSITPRLYVRDKIQDSVDDSYYWNVNNGMASFYDVYFPELIRMASIVFAKESKNGTYSTMLFSGVIANTNATVSDYINVLNNIKMQVEKKYQKLNLE